MVVENSTKRPVYEPTPMEISDIEYAINILESANAEISSVRSALLVLKTIAEKGETELCEGLAVWYAEGSHHLKRSPEKYLYYMTKAAEAGSEFAMSDLAWSYLKGENGVVKDTFLAHLYYYRLHKMFPEDKDYACWYALGIFNGHPVDPESDRGVAVDTLLEASDELLSQTSSSLSKRILGYTMIKDLADEGYPMACAMLKELKKFIAQDVTAKVAMKILYAFVNAR